MILAKILMCFLVLDFVANCLYIRAKNRYIQALNNYIKELERHNRKLRELNTVSLERNELLLGLLTFETKKRTEGENHEQPKEQHA